MMKSLVAIFLLATSAGLLGCANVEPSAPVRTPETVAPAPATPEPNDVVASQAETPVSPVEQVTAPPEREQGPATVAPAVTETPADTPSGGDSNDVHSDAARRHLAGQEDMPSRAHYEREPNDAVQQTPAEPNAPSFQDRYAAILATYVREDGLVDYGDLHRHRLELKAILNQLDELDPNVYAGWSPQEKLAFWINAYNLKMLDVIARNYPIRSSWWLRLTWTPNDIRHIEGIWTDYKFIVMDEEFTLAEVERRFFRGTGGFETLGTGGFQTRPYGDPRVFLALTYACQSSPPLCLQPYRGADLDRQLDEQVRRFLASPQGLQIDRLNKVVRLSALFKPTWRGKEFVSRYGTDKKFKERDPETRAVLSFLTSYLPREDVEFLEVENYSLEYLNFDWRLNDIAKGY